MANVGLSKPYIAKYNIGADGNVTYSNGMKLEKAVKTTFTPDTSEDNVLYGDNGPAESDKQFAGGTLTVDTTDLPLDAAALMYGMTEENVKFDGSETAVGKRISFGGSAAIPYMGYGVINKKIINNMPKFMAVIYKKVQFAYPGDDYETQGKTISWKTPSLSATVMRDDTEKADWRDWVIFDSEANAEKYIKQVLNITDTPAA